MADIFLGSGKPKLYLGEQPIGGDEYLYTEGLLYDFDGLVASADFVSRVQVSSGITAEVCFTMGANERTTARFLTLYTSISSSIALETFSGAKSLDLLVGGDWVTSAENTYPIPVNALTTLSLVLTDSNWTAYYNGVEVLNGSKSLSGKFADDCYVGRTSGATNRTLIDTVVHSARIYNRVLSAEEIAANRAVDVEKFGGG